MRQITQKCFDEVKGRSRPKVSKRKKKPMERLAVRGLKSGSSQKVVRGTKKLYHRTGGGSERSTSLLNHLVGLGVEEKSENLVRG